jgi:hypothetical protein
MRTDAAFCANGEVRYIMANRRAHGECASTPRGCEVVVGATCGGGRRVARRVMLRRLLNGRMGERRGMMVVWIAGLVVMSLVANLWFVVRLYLNDWH